MLTKPQFKCSVLLSEMKSNKEGSTKGNGKTKLHCLLDIKNYIQPHPYLINLSYTAKKIQISDHNFICTAPTLVCIAIFMENTAQNVLHN